MMHYLPTAEQASRMTTAELRDAFLVRGLFAPDAITLRRIDLDRVVLGGAVPATRPLELAPPDWLGAEFFTERRELGVLNIGAPGRVTVGGERYEVGTLDALYVGRGRHSVCFDASSSQKPSRFYLVSYPAHAEYPTTLVRRADAEKDSAAIGSGETASKRRVARYIHADGVRSAQLVMGVTTLESGSVWNTMPAHTHHRRTEVYLYFGVPADAVVVHLMGEPAESRHLIVRDGEVALSPGWSIHSGCGTANYSFCWAMGGENQVYTDMQPVDMGGLR
jgi:4-deoxy-L-threo-5-hexosulose-uronate ketol-isomerase